MSEMTNEQVRTILAEFMGWGYVKFEQNPLCDPGEGDIIGFHPISGYRERVPDYHESLDACREVIAKMRDLQENLSGCSLIGPASDHLPDGWWTAILPQPKGLARALAEVIVERGL